MIRLRPAGPHDCATMSALHNACFTRTWSAHEFALIMDRGGAFGEIAENVAALPVGFVFAWVIAEACELLDLAVLEEFRRQGVGKKLLEASMRRAAGMGAAKMFLEVELHNATAQKLYEGAGFVAMGRRKAYYRYPDGSLADALTMQAEL